MHRLWNRYEDCAIGVLARLAIAVSATSLLAAADRPAIPRVRSGKPDLQGIWDYGTVTPLQRPRGVADKPFFTQSEAREWERNTRERVLAGMPGVEAQLNADAGDVWTDWGNPTQPTRRTSLIVNPSDGRLPPLTAAAQQRRVSNPASDAADDPEGLPLATRCLRGGEGPPILSLGGHNNLVQIVQTDGFVVLATEMIHAARIVALSSARLPASIRQWSGDSRGRWDGDVLIVETTNFTTKTSFEGESDNLHRVGHDERRDSVRHVTERLTRNSASTLLYQFTVDDPATFTQPFSGELTMRQTSDRIFAYACHEGNYALANLLRSARTAERER